MPKSFPDNDPKGYYACLGLQPGATAALIRAAYKVRAMELHPDRNPDASATREFQQLQEAYGVLSSEEKRAAYDAMGRGASTSSRSSESTARSSSQDSSQGSAPGSTQSSKQGSAQESNTRSPSPVACSHCGAISAQPRVRSYLKITSFLVTSTKTTVGGIFCTACEVRQACKATGATLLLGWWSLHGFFWSLEALFKNLAGGPHLELENATVLTRQAMYFFATGKPALAHAVAYEAREVANTKKQYPEMQELLRYLEPLLSATSVGSGSSSPRLKTPSRFRNPLFGYQAAMVSAFALVVACLVAWNAANNARQEEERRAWAERARLAQIEADRMAGLERQAAQAAAKQKADELAALEKPLPANGVLWRSPSNKSFIAAIGRSDGWMAPLRVTAAPGVNFLVKLIEASSGEPLMTIFVRAGRTSQAEIPLGQYKLKMAAGQKWYGSELRFGPDTQYSEVTELVSFSSDGQQVTGHEINLSQVLNGNLRPEPIEPSSF